MPFSNFKPPMYKCDFDVPFAEQLSKINDPVVIPVQQGKRAYIKLGQESINSIQAVDIKGIIYYVDDDGNVYDPQDIIENNKNPKIIAKYIKEADEYKIPSLFNK